MPFPLTPSISVVSRQSIGEQLAIGGLGSGSLAWPAANDAIFVPFNLSFPILAKRMAVANGAAVGGNSDAGIYTLDGRLIVSSGAILQAGTSVVQFLDIADTYLGPGRYYMALSNSGTTGRYIRWSYNVGYEQLAGMLKAASANPLPASATLATVTATYIPLFGIEAMGLT